MDFMSNFVFSLAIISCEVTHVSANWRSHTGRNQSPQNMWIASLGDQLLSTKCNDEAKYEASTMTTAHVDIINDDNVIMCT